MDSDRDDDRVGDDDRCGGSAEPADGGAIEPTVRAEFAAGDDLAGILKMLTRSPDARGDLVEDIRAQLSEGSYLSEERLNLAIYKLLKDLLD